MHGAVRVTRPDSLHTDLLDHIDRRRVAGAHKREHLREGQLAEGIVANRTRGLGGVAAAPPGRPERVAQLELGADPSIRPTPASPIRSPEARSITAQKAGLPARASRT